MAYIKQNFVDDTVLYAAQLNAMDNQVALNESKISKSTGDISAIMTELDKKADESDVTALQDKVKDLELFKFPNVTIIGEPTINHGQVSGFTSASYLKFPFLVDFRNQAFEINMSFTTSANVTNQENIFDSDFGLAFAIRNKKFVIAISTNGTSWDLGEGVGTHELRPNTTYYVRISWDKTKYIVAFSFDNVSFITDITINSESQPYPKQIYIGVGENFASILNHFSGIINLNAATLAIGGEVVWSGMDDAGLSTRADVSLDNIDAAGVDRIRTSVIEDGVISTNTTYSSQKITNYVAENYSNKTDFDCLKRSNDALWKLSRGQIYDIETKEETGTNAPPSGAQFESILEVHGKSEQFTTTGKNLINPTLGTTSQNGITCTSNGDGTYTLNGTCVNNVAVFYFNSPIDAGTYKVVGCPSGGLWGAAEGSTYRIRIGNADNNDAFISNETGDGCTFILSVKTNIRLQFNIALGIKANNLVFKPMITKDLNATYDDYEPYTGGIPSPNPDYHQDIKSVEEINFAVGGKNLLDLRTISSTTATGVTITPIFVGGIFDHFETQGTASSTIFLKLADVALNGSYILSGCPVGGGDAKYALRYYDGGSFAGNDTGSGTTLTFTGTLGVYLRIQSGQDVNGLKFYPMVRFASISDATYEPYREPTTHTITPPFPLNKVENYLGTYSDNVDIDKGLWVKSVKSVDLGDLTWSYVSGDRRFVTPAMDDAVEITIQRSTPCICDIYKCVTDGHGYEPDRNYIAYFDTRKRIWIQDFDYTNAATFTNAVKGSTFYYPLAIPTSSPIAEDDLAYLKSLQMLSTSDNVITITDQDGNDISYLMEYIIKLSEVN